MYKSITKICLVAILLFVFQLTITAQPIGSQIKVGTDSHISYWNGSTWADVVPASGLPGQSLQFTAGVPSWINNPNGITTTIVTDIQGNTAVSGGNILSDGGSAIVVRGVCWNTSSNPTISDSKTIDGAGIGSFTSNLTNLVPETYYVRAYATNLAGVTAYGNQISFSTAIPLPPSIDIAGNQYETVQIGLQFWMKQNLSTTKYSNGEDIATGYDNATWQTLTTGAYSSNYIAEYGKLYNFYAAKDPRNVCPVGWHVPSDAEWNTLIAISGGESLAGKKLKEAGTVHWMTSVTGNNATNSTGFTALPGESRWDGVIGNPGVNGFWWTSSYFSLFGAAPDLNYGAYRSMDNQSYNVGYGGSFKHNGLSIRCKKGGAVSILSTTAANTITNNSAISGGNITSDDGSAITTRGICWSTNPNPTIAENHTTDGAGIGSFTSNITALLPNTTYFVRAYATSNDGTTFGNEVSFSTAAPIPEIGNFYQGGVIAYILQPGDPGYIAGETHGLIASSFNLSMDAVWGCEGTSVTGADFSALGTGNQNTLAILNACSTAGIAARLCADYSEMGYSDWYLPSKDELEKLYLSRNLIPGFTTDYYWSSTQYNNDYAYSHYFFSNFQNYGPKVNTNAVRAVRSF